jgi:hypothetical protein
VPYLKVDARALIDVDPNCADEEPAVDVAVDMIPDFCRQAKKR